MSFWLGLAVGVLLGVTVGMLLLAFFLGAAGALRDP